MFSGTIGQMTDRAMVSRWLAGYEAAWRAPGTAGLAEIFTGDATYRYSPYEVPVVGLDSVRRMWDEKRDGPDEVFTLATEILAVDGPTAVVRAEVRYGTRSARSIATCGSCRYVTTAAAPRSRNGPTGPAVPTRPAADRDCGRW